jgi:nitrate/nitrite transporter NarK
MKIFRSVASVLLSYIVVYGIVAVCDPILTHFFPNDYVAGKIPPTSLLWVSTVIFATASILGGWLCVRIAPSRTGMHLFVLFLVGEVIGLVFTARMWSSGRTGTQLPGSWSGPSACGSAAWGGPRPQAPFRSWSERLAAAL